MKHSRRRPARSCPSCASGQSRHSGVPRMRQKATHFFHADLSLAVVLYCDHASWTKAATSEKRPGWWV